MVSSDRGIFGTRILGYIVGVLISFFGLIILMGRKTNLGLLIIVIGLVLGRYLVWKSQRREGSIVYFGGRA